MSPRWLWGACLLLCFNLAQACINSPGTDHDGVRFVSDAAVGKSFTHMLTSSHAGDLWRAEAEEIVAKARAQPSFATHTNLGILLIHQRQYAHAIRLFLAVERQYPGAAATAANLGTALELAGHDAIALRWIRLGIRREPREHEGTEWLHVRILEAKIAAASDPSYLMDHSVAGVGFEQVLLPAIPNALPAGNDGRPVKPWELEQALNYQLYERIGFVKPKDAVVANLLHDYATLYLAGGPVETATALYDLAVDYGAPRDAQMRNRQSYIQRVLAQAEGTSGTSAYRCAICRP